MAGAAVDISAVAAALTATLSADAATRESASAQLKSLEGAPGFGATLLRVAEAAAADLATRQAAATFFKNFVKRQWVRVCARDA
jgi:exportin-2 (importin alpha re-exporter)